MHLSYAFLKMLRSVSLSESMAGLLAVSSGRETAGLVDREGGRVPQGSGGGEMGEKADELFWRPGDLFPPPRATTCTSSSCLGGWIINFKLLCQFEHFQFFDWIFLESEKKTLGNPSVFPLKGVWPGWDPHEAPLWGLGSALRPMAGHEVASPGCWDSTKWGGVEGVSKFAEFGPSFLHFPLVSPPRDPYEAALGTFGSALVCSSALGVVSPRCWDSTRCGGVGPFWPLFAPFLAV